MINIESLTKFYKYNTVEDLWEKLEETIAGSIRHPEYEETTEYADKCFQYITGDLQEEIVAKLRADQESEEQIIRRKKATTKMFLRP